METAFFWTTVIVLALGLAVVVGDPIQLPGQRSAGLPGAFSAPRESEGLKQGPGLPQREFK